ncbi:MAG: GTPase ObgE, GTP-binding protein, partial [Candidatus Parcubacteria bacterium]
DIPGLIEGASSGKGLGIKFLRHIERTRVLFHCISCELDDPVEAYKTITAELGSYKKILARHPQYIILTKTDTVSPERVREKMAELKKTKKTVIPVSAYDDVSLGELKKVLNVLENEKMNGAHIATE